MSLFPPPKESAIAQVVYTGDESASAIKGLLAAVVENEDSFERWETLVNRAAELEGGVTRNSNPAAIQLVREVYDAFLEKFPLFFGYWKKYADLEFAIGGPETADMVYERGVSAIPTSVDLWTNFCSFKMETCHDQDVIRVLFERAAYFVGLDYHGSPFWDKYIEFEERAQEGTLIIKLCFRAMSIVNHQCAKYFEKLLPLMSLRPVEVWAEPHHFEQIKAEVAAENQGLPEKAPLEIERQLLAKINVVYHATFALTQKQVHDRWHFEHAIRRPYFHVTDLPKEEILNWHTYLNFEEQQGNYEQTAFLYERCLVACALYEEFWLRYARWMFSKGKEENARIIYMRASFFVPVQRPSVRLKWARFEEKLGRVSIARDIHLAMLEQVPDNETIIVSLANIIRRHQGVDSAVALLEGHIERNSKIAGRLVAEQARILDVCKHARDEARDAFKKKAEVLELNKDFWVAWMTFEINQPAAYDIDLPATDIQEAHARVKEVYDKAPKHLLAGKGERQLSELYMKFLLQRGGNDVAEEYVLLDMWGNGYQRDCDKVDVLVADPPPMEF